LTHLDEMTSTQEAAEHERAANDASDILQAIHQCQVCLDFQSRVQGVLCSTQHFMCDDCFEGYVISIATADDRLARGADVRCCAPQCSAPPFDPTKIALHAQRAWPALERLKLDIKEAALVVENDRRVQELVKKEIKRGRRMSALELVMNDSCNYIIEQIMTLQCPQCEAGFVEFNDSCTFTCHRCNCDFHGWCLLDCSSVVSTCEPCKSRPRTYRGFGTSDFSDCMRRYIKLILFINGLRADIRAQVMAAVAREAADLGLILPRKAPVRS
jgi:hypothetical protein